MAVPPTSRRRLRRRCLQAHWALVGAGAPDTLLHGTGSLMRAVARALRPARHDSAPGQLNLIIGEPRVETWLLGGCWAACAEARVALEAWPLHATPSVSDVCPQRRCPPQAA